MNISRSLKQCVLWVWESHISSIENNRVKVSLSTLVQICNALNTTVDYILASEYAAPTSALEQEILHELHSCTDKTKEQVAENH